MDGQVEVALFQVSACLLYTSEKDTALRDHIKARITRKPNRIIKRSFIESAMCNHNIVMLRMGMLVFLGILGICIMPKQEMPQFTIRQGACVAVYPVSYTHLIYLSI